MGTEHDVALTPQVLPAELSPTTATLVHPPRLSPRKRSFCQAYRAHYNLKKAVAAAGITRLPKLRSSDPLRIGQVLLEETAVQAYLRYLSERDSLQVRPDIARIRDELLAIGFNDVGDMLDFGAPDPDGFRPVKRLRLDRGDGRVISAIKITDGAKGIQHIEVKFHPKIEALKLLATEAGMLADEARLPPTVNFHVHIESRR
jgi:Terminase small subunit